MMVVSEPTALFTLPFFITLSESLFNLLNESGVIFIPFFIALCRNWTKARALGQDEGSSHIMALKLVERDFITMFLVLLLCVIPLDFSNTSTSYKQFSTSSTPSLIQGVETVEELNPNTGFVAEFGNADMPFMFGVVHQFVTGFSNTLIGQIPCSKDNSGECVTDVSFPFLTKYLGSVSADSDSA